MADDLYLPGRRLAALLIPVLAILPAHAQRTPPSARQPSTFVIRGVAVGADTGLPVPDGIAALVPSDADADPVTRRLPASPASSVVSHLDDAGRFEFASVPAGRYTVLVTPGSSAAQYLPARFPAANSQDGPHFTVPASGLTEPIEVRLPRAAAIVGSVVDDRGRPVADVTVTAIPRLAGNRRGRAPRLGARSDDTGSFRLFGLPEGEYLLQAQPAMPPGHFTTVLPDGTTITTPQNDALVAQYYPGTTSASTAEPIRVAAGEVHGPLDFTLHRVRMLRVSGRLVDPAGQPVARMHVQLQPAGPLMGAGDRQTQTTRADGSFEIQGVPPGEYTLSAMRFGGDVKEFASTRFSVVDDVENLVLGFARGATVKGTLLFHGSASRLLPAMQVRAVPGGASASNAFSVQPDADGAFVLDGLFGPTLIRAGAPRGWHLEAVLYGGRDITDEPVEFAGGEAELQVVLTDSAASVAGTVRTPRGLPAILAAVLVFSQDESLWHDRFTTTKVAHAGGDGRFSVDGLRRGRYFVIAVERDEGSLSDAPSEYFALLARRATAVTLNDGEAVVANLTLVTLGRP